MEMTDDKMMYDNMSFTWNAMVMMKYDGDKRMMKHGGGG